MNKQFGFVNISAGAIRDGTNTVIINDYNTTANSAYRVSGGYGKGVKNSCTHLL